MLVTQLRLCYSLRARHPARRRLLSTLQEWFEEQQDDHILVGSLSRGIVFEKPFPAAIHRVLLMCAVVLAIRLSGRRWDVLLAQATGGNVGAAVRVPGMSESDVASSIAALTAANVLAVLQVGLPQHQRYGGATGAVEQVLMRLLTDFACLTRVDAFPY